MKTKFFLLGLLSLTMTSLQAQVDRSKMPTPGPSPEINLGVPDSFTLDNGLEVLVVENHKLPHVRANLTIDNKPYPQGNKAGLKSLYSAMMGNGTEKMDKETFHERVDFLGASVGYGAESAYASSLTKFFPEVFGLMADGLLHPKLTEEEFETQKKRAIEGIESQQNNANAIASNLNGALTYGKHHPYGEFATVESVKNIELPDVQIYYQNFITPKNAYLVVVGDIDLAEVKKLVNKYFADWTEETPPSVTLPEVPPVQFTQIDFVNVPNAVQSVISVMNAVHLKKTNSDYFAALMANQILGGGSGSRLFNDLREDKAYTYGAYSSLSSDKYVSQFKAYASVRNEVTDSAVVAFLTQINKMRNQKVDRQELLLAKAKYTGNFVRALESPSTIAQYALNIKMDNLPADFYRNYLKNIQAVTIDEVQEAAQKYFEAGHARVIIAGNGKAVASSLEKVTYNGKAVPVKYFNEDAEPIAKPEFNKAAPDNVTVKSVYDHYIEAIGGRDAAEGVKTLYVKAQGQMGPRTITLTIKATKDGKSSTEMAMGAMSQKMVFDGEKGYVEMAGQRQPMSQDQIKSYKESPGIFPELVVKGGVTVTGIEKVNGEEAYVVKVNDKESNYYSVATGLKLQTVTQEPMSASTKSYSDYKAVDGVKYPFTMTRSIGPRTIAIKVLEITPNKGVSPSDFE